MKRIISLANEKNHYLEKFYALNERELENFVRDDFSSIEGFYETRERILEVIKYIDSQIEIEHNRNPQMAEQSSLEEKKALLTAMSAKDQYVARILEQDLKVLSCIEAAKNSIIRELGEVRKGKKAVGGYRAPNLIQRLDEKA